MQQPMPSPPSVTAAAESPEVRSLRDSSPVGGYWMYFAETVLHGGGAQVRASRPLESRGNSHGLSSGQSTKLPVGGPKQHSIRPPLPKAPSIPKPSSPASKRPKLPESSNF